jgi:hypothetical protein
MVRFKLSSGKQTGHPANSWQWGMGVGRGKSAGTDNNNAREHSACYQQSGFGSASERYSPDEKAVNRNQPNANGCRDDKVLARLRSVHGRRD